MTDDKLNDEMKTRLKDFLPLYAKDMKAATNEHEEKSITDFAIGTIEHMVEQQAQQRWIAGDFVIDNGDVDKRDPAMIVMDLTEEAGTYMIKRTDGHLSQRSKDQLEKASPIDFIKVWCKNQIEFPEFNQEDKG